ncbi:dual specificity protein phosphatase PPS1 [Westerdykella ornata]|uniref:Dual specificity protein phosphatase PPS1 n=1 Tax=Westerdykella ornata TaxID=318751 RepID=A0A6A6JAW6_WESOR|nr:dual specificity protein phosphatase PPS1 [Westerdykella ornata]KAF2273552.1 dual specificity protein phosphatase PPS1 [Westerdykella ornata]
MATAVARVLHISSRSSSPPPQLNLNTSARSAPSAIPNKHIPLCPPSPVPVQPLDTPPSSPPTKDPATHPSSLLHPPTLRYDLFSSDPPLYTITADKLLAALEHMLSQPLPDPDKVFPWLHGLHADNQVQLNFFVARRRSVRRVPRCLRSITIVKARGDLSTSRLRGAIAPDELLASSPVGRDAFLECDPRDGFSVRNFQIQACKLAMVSDIIVYGDDDTPTSETAALARRISRAQRLFEATNSLPQGLYNTFILADSFSDVHKQHPQLVAVDELGQLTGNISDLCYWERYEMCTMSKASEISRNVFLGPSQDPTIKCDAWGEHDFDVLIEASDCAQIPDALVMQYVEKRLQKGDKRVQFEFPSSGNILPPSWSHAEVDGLLATCRWIYNLANPQDVRRSKRRRDEDDEAIELNDMAPARKLLLHCSDGYTETSLLALAYYMYAERVQAHEAWVQLHRDKRRNFFAYPTDVSLLSQIEPRILQESPKWKGNVLELRQPKWMANLDGSLPSRILPYLYLGNLLHANNPEVLRQLGITQILSVGESLTWPEDVQEKLQWPSEKLMMVDGVQDNGVDPLWNEFGRCLKFIEAGKADGGATLVHCRVGVSRSATICIAEVMNELGLSFPRAYCFVRARRLNVIIQPHLRFTYELLKWEEYQRLRRKLPLRRELEWATIAREIALMNKPYSR